MSTRGSCPHGWEPALCWRCPWPELTVPEPTQPEIETLRQTLAAFDDWPPSGPQADRAEAQAVAEAARAVVALYDAQVTAMRQAAAQQITEAQIEQLLAAPRPEPGGCLCGLMAPRQCPVHGQAEASASKTVQCPKCGHVQEIPAQVFTPSCPRCLQTWSTIRPREESGGDRPSD
ncbi:hypothetical protein Jolie1_064 [Mycobacterium phage Julie1]|uniref:Uncharacterized protein n=1 Tax=Mycobacterium phage Julie1 TaxID=1463812 RepID=W8EIS5_9CAUD|nr:hypothetical protein CG90_gp64 [Mycobacterium phage Julie1]AHJ88564.1 hypothetical protein Jolie1_064 [Mycobacterium phage Julie1]